MAGPKDAGDSNQFTQIMIGIIVVGALLGFGVGPVQTWVRKAQKHSLQAGLRNLRDAYSAHYVQKSGYPSDDLSELKAANGGAIHEWPIDSTTGLGSVSTKLTGRGGWYHDTTKHEVHLNKKGSDYFGNLYAEY